MRTMQLDEEDLAELERDARYRIAHHVGGASGPLFADEVLDLIAEVRRLRAELYNREHTRTVGTAPVIGPEAAR